MCYNQAATYFELSMKHAFSLVELSIVLVILGLLTGGILTGQSLIRAAELRSVTTELQNYQTSVFTFRDKYFAIPGDMRNATRFWGRLNGNADCVTNSSAAVAAGGVCDGNGDGLLNPPAASGQAGEVFGIWQHLANAGLVEGRYSGITGTGGRADSEIGDNVPASKLSNAGWSASYLGPAFLGDANTYQLPYGNHFRYGASDINASTQGAVLTPEEAWNIETKVDDGQPASGKIIARFWNNACSAADNGTHADNNYEASYRLSDNSVQCALFLRNLF